MHLHKRIRPTKMNRIFRPCILIILVIVAVLGLLAVVEFNTFYLQSRFLSQFAQKLSFSIKPGQNPSLSFPNNGPYDKRLGYTQLPVFIRNLLAQGYRIEAQARLSPELDRYYRPGGFTRVIGRRARRGSPFLTVTAKICLKLSIRNGFTAASNPYPP